MVATMLFASEALYSQADSLSSPQTDSSNQTFAQKQGQGEFEESDTVSLVVERKVSPKRAALLSAVLPGAGQIYNRRYWKLPIVYGALGSMAYLYLWNRSNYIDFRDAYINDLDSDAEGYVPSSFALDGITPTQLRDAADASQRNMELAIVGFTLAWGLQIVDAAVDAHLHYFDVSEDLTLRVQPTMNIAYNNRPIQGLSLNLTF